MRIATAIRRYALINRGAINQFCFNQTVATSLLNSRTIPITAIGIAAAAKMLIKPATE